MFPSQTHQYTHRNLSQNLFGKGLILKGRVVHVGDGDNFRFLHTPLFRRYVDPKVDNPKLKLDDYTIHVRVCGVDAPEVAHFEKKESQPYAVEAHNWLKEYLTGQKVTIELLRPDQYARAVCSVWKRDAFFRKRNVSLELVRAGYAMLYESKDAVFGRDLSPELIRKYQQKAREEKVGQFAVLKTNPNASIETPGEYKVI